MSDLLYKILHVLSKLSCYAVAFCLVFLAQNYTLGLIPPIKHLVLGNFYFKDILFIFISLFVVIKYVNVSTPYKKYINK